MTEPKHYWNYRVLKRKHEWKGDVEYSYGVYEVYYENNVPISCMITPTPLRAEYFTELEWLRDKMQAAFDKPILDYDSFEEITESQTNTENSESETETQTSRD